MLTSPTRLAFAAIALALSLSSITFAQTSSVQPAAAGAGDDAELAKKLSNPISDLVSVPFQFNWEQNVGPDNRRGSS